MDIQCLLCASTDSGNEINILNNEYSLQRVNEVLNLSVSHRTKLTLYFIKKLFFCR